MNAKEAKLSHDRLVDLLEYNERTGEFTWKKRVSRNVFAGTVAGTIGGEGYRQIKVDKELYRAHRLAWFYMYKEWAYPQIDHINRDKLDNRIENLRVCTNLENSHNRPSYKGGNTRQTPEWKAHKKEYDRQRYLTQKKKTTHRPPVRPSVNKLCITFPSA